MDYRNNPNSPIYVPERKWKPYLLRLLRTAIVGAAFMGLFCLTGFCLRFGSEWRLDIIVESPERTLAIGCSLIFLLTLNTILINFAQYDRFERARFTKQYGKEEDVSIKAECDRILHSYSFWTEIVGLAAIYLFCPLSWELNSIPYAILGEASEDELIARVVLMLVAVPVTIGLDLFAYLSARQCWREEHPHPNERKRIPEIRLIQRMIFVFTLYGPAFFVLPLLIPTIKSILSILFVFRAWRILPTIAIILLAVAILIYFRALRHRRRFIRRLQKLCHDEHYELSNIKHPYLSLFFTSEDANFTVFAHGKIYECRILGSVKRSNAMHLSPEGVCSHAFAFVLRRVEFFRIERNTDYRFESQYKKVLIITPVPKKLFSTFDRISFELDNGDRVGEYTIFSGGGFLGALERDCVDRSVKS